MAKKTKKKKIAQVEPVVTAEIKIAAPSTGRRLVLGAVLALLAAVTIAEVIAIVGINIRNNKKPATLAQWRPGSNYTGFTSMHVYGRSLYFVDSTRSTMTENEAMTGNMIMKYSLAQGIHGMARLSNGDVLVIAGGNTLVRFPAGSVNPVLPGTALSGCNAAGYLAVDSKDNVHVLDPSRRVLIKYDMNLNKVSETGAGELSAPRRVYTGPDDSMYVIDAEGPQKTIVKIFSAKGPLVKKFGVLKNQPVSTYTCLAVASDGGVYVNDQQNGGVASYGPGGKLRGRFADAAGGSINISHPPGIAGGMGGFFVVPAAEMLVLQEIKY